MQYVCDLQMETDGDEQSLGVNELKENGESEKAQEEDTESTPIVKKLEKFCMFTEYYLVRIQHGCYHLCT